MSVAMIIRIREISEANARALAEIVAQLEVDATVTEIQS